MYICSHVRGVCRRSLLIGQVDLCICVFTLCVGGSKTTVYEALINRFEVYIQKPEIIITMIPCLWTFVWVILFLRAVIRIETCAWEGQEAVPLLKGWSSRYGSLLYLLYLRLIVILLVDVWNSLFLCWCHLFIHTMWFKSSRQIESCTLLHTLTLWADSLKLCSTLSFKRKTQAPFTGGLFILFSCSLSEEELQPSGTILPRRLRLKLPLPM